MNADDLDGSAVQPGAYIEIRPALWRGYVRTAPVGGRFLADPEDRGVDWQRGMPTSWSADAIESVRVLAAPVDLPTVPGTQFVGTTLADDGPVVWSVHQGLTGEVFYLRISGDNVSDTIPAVEAAARGLRVTGTVRPPLTVDGAS